MLDFVRRDLDACGIKYEKSPVHENCTTPNSAVIISNATASRTIVHANFNLPELSPADFEQFIVPTDYAWMHFEVGCMRT